MASERLYRNTSRYRKKGFQRILEETVFGWYQWTIGIALYPARSHGKIIKVPLMRSIFTNRTIGMTSFSVGTNPTVGTNGPSVWRIVSVCVYWTWSWKLTRFLTSCISATSFEIWTFSDFLYISERTRMNFFKISSHNLYDIYNNVWNFR